MRTQAMCVCVCVRATEAGKRVENDEEKKRMCSRVYLFVAYSRLLRRVPFNFPKNGSNNASQSWYFI